MSTMGFKHSEETKRRISERVSAVRMGRRHSEETKRKIGKAVSGKKNGSYGKTGDQCPLFGLVRSKETREKVAQANKGKKLSDETKRKMSNAQSGKKNGFYGRKHSKKARGKMSDACQDRVFSDETRLKISLAISGEKSPHWKGGISIEPYCDIWADKEYKEDIRERDGHTCQNPDCWGDIKEGEKLSIHHIDYDKKNCHSDNLITLCRSCNSRANVNRDYWKELYVGLIGGGPVENIVGKS